MRLHEEMTNCAVIATIWETGVHTTHRKEKTPQMFMFSFNRVG